MYELISYLKPLIKDKIHGLRVINCQLSPQSINEVTKFLREHNEIVEFVAEKIFPFIFVSY